MLGENLVTNCTYVCAYVCTYVTHLQKDLFYSYVHTFDFAILMKGNQICEELHMC